MHSDQPRAALDFYKAPAPITDVSKYRVFLEWLTDDIRAIVQVVQGLLVHDGWVKSYGIAFNDGQRYDFTSLTMESLLDKATSLDHRSLAISRAPEKRVMGCCREFAALMTAICRFKGIPARSRCGFAKYFASSVEWEDHWVCEYWSAAGTRWVRVDPQIDPFQESALHLAFSPLDIPADQFLTGAGAWTLCQERELDPEQFGIGGNPVDYGLDTLRGLWFVRGNLLRDFAALNKVETVPLLLRLWRGLDWSPWRLVGSTDADLSEKDRLLLDRVAQLSASLDESFFSIRELYTSSAELQPGSRILTYA